MAGQKFTEAVDLISDAAGRFARAVGVSGGHEGCAVGVVALQSAMMLWEKIANQEAADQHRSALAQAMAFRNEVMSAGRDAPAPSGFVKVPIPPDEARRMFPQIPTPPAVGPIETEDDAE